MTLKYLITFLKIKMMEEKIKQLIEKYKKKITFHQLKIKSYEIRGMEEPCINEKAKIQAIDGFVSDLKNLLT